MCRTVGGEGQPNTLHSLSRRLCSLSILLLFLNTYPHLPTAQEQSRLTSVMLTQAWIKNSLFTQQLCLYWSMFLCSGTGCCFISPTPKPELSPKLSQSESLFYLTYCLTRGDLAAWTEPKYKYNETKTACSGEEVELTWSHFGEFGSCRRPVSKGWAVWRVQREERDMAICWGVMRWWKGKIFHPCVYRLERLGYWDPR